MSRRIPQLDGLIDPNVESGEPPGPFNEFSCEFNGTDETVNFGSTAFNYQYTQPLSFGFWMKCTGGGGPMAILSKYKFNYNQDGWAILKDSNERLSFLISQGWYPESRARTNNNQVTLNTWEHWVITRPGTNDPDDVKFYKNATLLTTNNIDDSGPTDMLSSADFCIGSGNALEDYFSGFLDEITIWEKELSQAEVTELYNGGVAWDINTHSAALTSLKGWYRCGDNETYPSFVDAATNGYGYGGFMVNMGSSNFSTDVP
jgi:hypothetical protein